MTEQYIYSRSEREFTNARNQTVSLGFGFVALSPGMDDALKQCAAVHCEDCPRFFRRDGQDSGLPLLRKTRLPAGQILLQESAWIENSSRDFHVAHGYVLEAGTAKDAGPAKWFALPFQLGNPNAVKDGVLLDSLPELPDQGLFEPCGLRDAALGLDRDQFCQLLLACFDALASRRQVLIACDLEENEGWKRRLSSLYWIYTFLPLDLWTGLGFDSVYTEKSSPGQVHLAFVDRASLQGDGRETSVQIGNNLLPLGGNFLVLDGTIIHNDSKYQTDWYGKDGVYARWLKRIVDIVWDSPAEKGGAAAGELAAIHQILQRQLDSVPAEQRLDPQVYGSACGHISALEDLEQACGRVKAVDAESQSEPVPAPKSEPDQSEQSHTQQNDPKQSYTQPVPSRAVQSLPAMNEGAVEQWLEQCKKIAAAYDPAEDVRAYVRRSLDGLPGISGEQRGSVEEELWKELFGWVFTHRTLLVVPKNIKPLAAMYGGRIEDAAMGLLGVIVAEYAGKPKKTVKLEVVLLYCQRLLPPNAYARMLCGLFWDKLNGEERTIWNSCRMENSTEAAAQRRGAWYREIAAAYDPAENIETYVNRSLDVLSGIGEQYRALMGDELQMFIEMYQRILRNGGPGVLK